MDCILKKTSQFKASFKLAKKRGLDISLLEEVIDKLIKEEKLDEKYHNHQLVGTITTAQSGSHARPKASKRCRPYRPNEPLPRPQTPFCQG